jgi:hypothetical protein
MSEMIERMARAICNSVEADDFDTLPDGIVRAAYMQQARAAIEAMRCPTRGMLDAAYMATKIVGDTPPGVLSPRNKMRTRWDSMIDAALDGNP